MLVERHRHDAQFLSEPPHVQRVDPSGVNERHSGAQHTVSAERQPTLNVGLLHHFGPLPIQNGR